MKKEADEIHILKGRRIEDRRQTWITKSETIDHKILKTLCNKYLILTENDKRWEIVNCPEKKDSQIRENTNEDTFKGNTKHYMCHCNGIKNIRKNFIKFMKPIIIEMQSANEDMKKVYELIKHKIKDEISTKKNQNLEYLIFKQIPQMLEIKGTSNKLKFKIRRTIRNLMNNLEEKINEYYKQNKERKKDELKDEDYNQNSCDE